MSSENYNKLGRAIKVSMQVKYILVIGTTLTAVAFAVSLFLTSTSGSSEVSISAPVRMEHIGATGAEQDRYYVQPRARFPLIAFAVSLRPGVSYRLCLPKVMASGRSSVVVDIAGTGYDSARQEHSFNVSASRRTVSLCFDFDSENPPSDTALRVMPDGRSRVSFGTPVLYEVKSPRLERSLHLAGLAGLVLVLAGVSGLLLGWVRSSLLPVQGRARVAMWSVAYVLAFELIFVCTMWMAFSSPFPWVFSDEYSYAWLAKHGGDIAEAARVGLVSTLAHSFLYFYVYGAAFFHHADSYVLNKVINLAFWFCAGGAAYFAALRFLTTSQSALFSICVLVSPWVVYTRVFMPETMYYFGFWMSVAAYVWLWKPGIPRGELVLGVLLGALTLVKSHAMFMLPGFVIGSVVGHLLSAEVERFRVVKAGCAAMVLLLGWILSKVLLTSALADGSLNQLAGGYGGEMVRAAMLLSEPLQSLVKVLNVFSRHVGIAVIASGGALVFVLPVVVQSVRRVCGTRPFDSDDARDMVLIVSSAVIAVTLLLITAIYTVSIGHAGGFESVERTHTRYYGFVLPFILLAGMCAVRHMEGVFDSKRLRFILIVVAGGLGACALLVDPASLYANDGPDALVFADPVLRFLVVPLFCAFLAWLFKPGLRHLPEMLGVWVVVMGLANACLYVTRYYEMTSVASPTDAIGGTARNLILESERDDGVILAPDNSIDLYRLMFYLNAKSPVQIKANCSAAAAAARNDGRKWLIAFGYDGRCTESVSSFKLSDKVWLYRFDTGVNAVQVKPELGERAAEGVLVFGKSDAISLKNANSPEAWGVWLPPDASFEFSPPVSGVVTVELTASGFGPNIGKEITAVLGDSIRKFTLTAAPKTYVLKFESSQAASTLRFVGLVGLSPKAAEVSGGKRVLSMGVAGLVVNLRPESGKEVGK